MAEEEGEERTSQPAGETRPSERPLELRRDHNREYDDRERRYEPPSDSQSHGRPRRRGGILDDLLDMVGGDYSHSLTPSLADDYPFDYQEIFRFLTMKGLTW